MGDGFMAWFLSAVIAAPRGGPVASDSVEVMAAGNGVSYRLLPPNSRDHFPRGGLLDHGVTEAAKPRAGRCGTSCPGVEHQRARE